MKNEALTGVEVCARTVLAASTASEIESAFQPAGLTSLIADALSHGTPTPRGSSRPSFRLTERDRQVVDLVFRARALRADQMQTALFSVGAASRCQRRLTLLTRHHYLDRLPRRSVNEPAVYVLSRRSIAGNRLMRQRWGETALRDYFGRLGPIAHLLAINDLRVRAERECRDHGWSLTLWQRSDELAPILASVRLIPDAYLHVQRTVAGQPRTAAFFLEVERAAKSGQVMRSKLARYGELYYSGRYQALFGTRALRVLFVFAESRVGITRSAPSRAQIANEQAKRLGVTIARCTDLDRIKGAGADGCFTAPVWSEPGQCGLRPLFDRSATP